MENSNQTEQRKLILNEEGKYVWSNESEPQFKDIIFDIEAKREEPVDLETIYKKIKKINLFLYGIVGLELIHVIYLIFTIYGK